PRDVCAPQHREPVHAPAHSHTLLHIRKRPVPQPNRATRGSLIFKKGEQTVSGQKALDYVCIRHGIGDGSDSGRIKRQQAFTSSLLKKIKSNGLTPTKLLPLASAATESMTVDPGLGTPNKLITFAMSLKNIALHDTKFVTTPWRCEGPRVAVVQPVVFQLWAALKDDHTIDGKDTGGNATRPPSASTAPTTAPTSVADDARPADDDLYSGLTYGSGG
ncbi:LCP family protein, partial [Streptomyces sp. NPDC047009]|uniref:LCP family protein n=1 Tax=Streptomyces sp. NPDC047009 TaxID=3154496 RepID=UPI0033C160AF